MHGVSFTPPTGPSGGMSRDGHATIADNIYLKWVVVGIGVVVLYMLWRKK